MGDRFFSNEMLDYIPETHESAALSDSLTKLIHLPLKILSKRLKKDALDIKDTACETASQGSGRGTFICGEAGVCALGAVAAHHSSDEKLCQHYVSQFKEIKLSTDIPDELLYGRAGFLWACSFLNKHVGANTVSTTRMRAAVNEIIRSGRQLGNGNCPLMYQWHGKRYWEAAHGLAGIMNVLMDVELKPDEVEDVKATLRYMIKNRFPSGNYPSSEGNETDKLVHWCHGAPGVKLLQKQPRCLEKKSLYKLQLMQGTWSGIEAYLNGSGFVTASVGMPMYFFLFTS